MIFRQRCTFTHLNKSAIMKGIIAFYSPPDSCQNLSRLSEITFVRSNTNTKPEVFLQRKQTDLAGDVSRWRKRPPEGLYEVFLRVPWEGREQFFVCTFRLIYCRFSPSESGTESEVSVRSFSPKFQSEVSVRSFSPKFQSVFGPVPVQCRFCFAVYRAFCSMVIVYIKRLYCFPDYNFPVQLFPINTS